jgi:AMP nucleosidase
MISEGIKTDKSDALVTTNFVEEHVYIGIEALKTIIENKETVKHLRFEW